MSVTHLPAGNDWFTTEFRIRLCQSFRPNVDFIVHYVDIELKGVDAIGLPSCCIHYADGADHPLPDVLSRSGVVVARPKDIGIKNRWRLKMGPYTLYKDTPYCLTVYGVTKLPPVTFETRYEKDTGTYPRGFMSTSDDSGATWTSHPNDDLLFAVWGNPPAPSPPPDPPIINWTILTIEQTLTSTGYKIVVTTNTPCHLHMLWTKAKPWKHTRAILRRGIFWKNAIRFCFTKYHENQQQEAGDTLTHTFIKEPWPECETRWFTFRARVDGEWSPSIGPIFEKHRVAPAAPQVREKHDAPLDGQRDIAAGSEIAQSFTPQMNYAVSKLELPLWKQEPDYNGTIKIQIRTNDVNHPSETILWETTISASDLPPAAYQWFTFDVEDVSAEIGVPLWIVLIWTDYTYWFWPPYIMSDTDDLYPRGESLSRPVAGEWSGYDDGIDLGFRTWGI